jgi:oligo-1,6-glucosidase
MDKGLLAENAVYQIYPISYKDSNGDGKGDLKGIISKLDYLQSIGIHLIWLSPIYMSPMFDMGYDISDYKKVNPIFGTMEDFDTLIAEAKKRNIRIIMDLVVNHTSSEHPWFKAALADPTSPYRDYYIFREGKGKNHSEYPNNWTSSFLGPAWSEVPNEKGMFYLHIFTDKQPDLNWHNPAVLKEVEDILSFWMDKGVYGFRCDVITYIYKDSLEDGINKGGFAPRGSEHYVATQGCHAILKQLRKDVVEPHHGVLIGEASDVTLQTGPKFLDNELDCFFQFEIANLDVSLLGTHFVPKHFKDVITRWQEGLDWNANYFENHDQRRTIGRYVKEGPHAIAGSTMLLTLLFALRGTPFIYMGEELGARNYPFLLSRDETRDVVTHYVYDIARKKHFPKKWALRISQRCGRDNERAPMAFSSEDGYGFSEPGVTPWQVYNPLGKEFNVANEEKDPDSTLTYFKKINAFRAVNPVLSYGDFKAVPTTKNVFAFTRSYQDTTLLILLNLRDKEQKISQNIEAMGIENVLLSNQEGSLSETKLLPYEARILKLK